MEKTPTPEPVLKEKSSYGSLISIIIVVVVLIAGARYVWHKRIMQMYPHQQPAATQQASTSTQVPSP